MEKHFRMEDDDVLFVHPGIRLNHSDVLTLLRGETLPTYSVSISLDGYYLFNSEAGRIETTANFKRLMNVLLDKFPEREKFKISVQIDYGKGKEKDYLNDTKSIVEYLKKI